MKLCMGCMNEIEDHITTCPFCGYDETTLIQESYYLNPGSIVGGKYIIGRVLEYGGYSVTYLGWDAEYNRKVTIREYLPSDFSTRAKGDMDVTIYSGDALMQYEEGLATFLNEANTIEHLPDLHGVAKVYDCISENETGYVIQEYLDGQSLKEIWDAGKRYGVEETVQIIRVLLAGLSELHANGVMHYDIAPENVVITTNGEVKLINFGATKYSTTSNSKSLAIILKPGYAPEEQYRSMGQKGPWSDVYAVAAVMYQMLTGVIPDESVERAMIDNLKTPSEMGVKISKSVENALMNALNVYKENRTPSAQRFMQDLASANVKRVVEKQVKLETGKFPLWAKGLVAGLACVIVVGSAYFISSKDTNEVATQTIQMIDTYEMNALEAKTSIEELGAKCRIEYVPDTEDPEGTIWMQSVEAGKAIKGNTLVVLNVSGGDAKLTIPNTWIDQAKCEEIIPRLQSYHVDCSMIEEMDGERKGYHLISRVFIDDKEVTKEQIESGDAVFEIGQNHLITLYYYKPDESNFEFQIPNFVGTGKTIDDVNKIASETGEVTLKDLEDRGYEPVKVYGVNMKEKQIVYQTKTGKAKISAKNAVEFYYCARPLSYRMGDGPRELSRILRSAGVLVKEVEDVYSDEYPKGTICRVDYPGDGNYAKEGEVVTIHLSKGEKPEPVSQPQKPSEKKQQEKAPKKDKNRQKSESEM